MTKKLKDMAQPLRSQTTVRKVGLCDNHTMRINRRVWDILGEASLKDHRSRTNYMEIAIIEKVERDNNNG